MDRSAVLTLVKESYTQTAEGVEIPTETYRKIYARSARSVTKNEFFDGGRNGLKPELEFEIFFGDYEGEKICIYRGVRYSIYRVYQGNTDTLELYVEKKGGV